jgi:hypothetical protein
MNSEHDLVLRTCDPDMTSFDGFKWPNEGDVEAPDWDPKPECGHGLHGLFHGCGDATLLSDNSDTKWLVVKVLKDTTVDLGGKVKFPKGIVVYAGTKEEAVKIIAEAYPEAPVVFANRYSGNDGISISGDRGTSTSGHYGKSTSGHYGASISGYHGNSTSGYRGASTSGDYGASTSGDYGASTSGNYGKSTSGILGKSTSGILGKSTSDDDGTSTSGNFGISISGDYGKSISGYYGKSISGYHGVSTSGDYGESTSGIGGTSTAGIGGKLIIDWRDSSRHRTAVAYVGENGIEPNVAYRLDRQGDFIKA